MSSLCISLCFYVWVATELSMLVNCFVWLPGMRWEWITRKIQGILFLKFLQLKGLLEWEKVSYHHTSLQISKEFQIRFKFADSIMIFQKHFRITNQTGQFVLVPNQTLPCIRRNGTSPWWLCSRNRSCPVWRRGSIHRWTSNHMGSQKWAEMSVSWVFWFDMADVSG